jgi:hypothetical protein
LNFDSKNEGKRAGIMKILNRQDNVVPTHLFRETFEEKLIDSPLKSNILQEKNKN